MWRARRAGVGWQVRPEDGVHGVRCGRQTVGQKRPSECVAGKWGKVASCTGSTGVKHQLEGRAKWLGCPRDTAELAEGGPRCGGARAKGAGTAYVLDAHLS